MKRFIISLFVVSLTMQCGHAMTRDQMRSLYAEIVDEASNEKVFDRLPDTVGFTSVGQLTKEKEENALDYVNFLRNIAGLGSLKLNPLYSARAQHAACLLATNDELTHTPECPKGVSIPMYQTALEGASASNLVKLEWTHPEILLEGISYFARDDGDDNLAALPHRRWLFDPSMQETGFGMAESQNGNTYIAMYAVDGAEKDCSLDYTLWPSDGLFPSELMRADLPWSVMLNEDIFDIEHSNPQVTLTETMSGNTYLFDLENGCGDGICGIDLSEYGYGPCLYFLPDTDKFEPAYEQNRVWKVCVTGLVRQDGTSSEIDYECRMISLTMIETVNVELSDTKIAMKTGDQITLEASVIPCYADDVTVVWSSDNTEIAVVDDTGTVTAVAEGKCTVSAETSNGICDMCAVTVNG